MAQPSETSGAASTPVESEGAKRRRRAQGARADDLQAALADVDTGLASYADEFIFGQVWGRPGLGFRDRMLVAITALAACGQSAQLKNYLHGALQDGIPASELHEVFVMLTVYCGFPRALDGMVVWQSVLESARRQGLPIDLDQPGR